MHNKNTTMVGTTLENIPLAEKFKTLLAEYQDMVYNQVYRMLGNHEDAEEATQDIFLSIYRSLEDFRGECKMSTWIYRIMSNMCITRLRKRQLVTTSMDEPFEPDGRPLSEILPDSGSSPEKLMESTEIAQLVCFQMSRLPAQWAMAISLFHFDDLSYDEIAGIMEVPKATVATYIMRGRKQLAQWLMNALRT